MTDSRVPGRYNLHRLGWNAFEDLCMQVMRVVLGETCTRFRPGPDGGRDGWFHGQATCVLAAQNKLEGDFIVQCKHTSLAHEPLTIVDLKPEIKKIERANFAQRFHYILMTNRQVSAQYEVAIRNMFESIESIGRCVVLSETWIEDTIDAHPRLLRLVPRLYGIGDLSQILSHSIQQQTVAVLEDLTTSLRTFVPTDSYRRAERALQEHGFVVLVGPPASGKSAIAANLCMVNIAQDPAVRVLRIEGADQFKATWSPADSHTIYWVDDVFGELTLDEVLLKQWSAALDKVEAARKRGSRIVFCTRDYILSAAEVTLKRAKADLINDARVRVDVTNLSDAERDGILYNHIKDGDIEKEHKSHLKKYLSRVARFSSFSPELARRLGSKRFNTMFMLSEDRLRSFFDRPVEHFRDIIHGLSKTETAALAVCLLSNNAVPDPVPDDALAEAVLRSYGVSMQEVREAFETLEGSLVKRIRTGTQQHWQLHHPSMIEALQEELSSKSSHLVLYLQSARMTAIFRDTTTLTLEADSRLVFVPESAYIHLIERLRSVGAGNGEAVANYLLRRASDRFLIELDAKYPEILDRSLTLVPDPDGLDVSPKLAVRLFRVPGGNLLGDARRANVVDAVVESVGQHGWSGFLAIPDFDAAIPGLIGKFLESQAKDNFSTFESLYDWYTQDISSHEHVDSAIEALDEHAVRLQAALSKAGVLSDNTKSELTKVKQRLDARLQERRTDIEEAEERRADAMQDEWKERYHEERYELENGRFADVDE
jgi:hypothetical protein